MLKEKGINAQFKHAYYNPDKDGCRQHYCKYSHAVAMKWLRQVKNINIFILPLRKGYTYSLYNNTGALTLKEIREYSTYENATEEALKYILKNLI